MVLWIDYKPVLMNHVPYALDIRSYPECLVQVLVHVKVGVLTLISSYILPMIFCQKG